MVFSSLNMLLTQLNHRPESIEFNDVIAFIDAHFTFTPTAFTNGNVKNETDQNNGSCKILALGQHLSLTNAQTLALFGKYYRDDVLGNPAGTDHANIRSFMLSGSEGVAFEVFPLQLKTNHKDSDCK